MSYRHPVGWMAENRVAANLMMLVFVVGGLILGLQVKQEVFPAIDFDVIQVMIPYPGAGPEEVEDGILLAVEEAVSGLEGIKKVTATAVEGSASISIEVLDGEDADGLLQDVKSEVDRITSFPEDAEEPVIRLATLRSEVITVALYGDVGERSLRERADAIREELLGLPEVTQVEVTGLRPYEISVAVNEESLREYGLTLNRLAGIIRDNSQDIPAGVLKAAGGEILLRSKERKRTGLAYEKIPVRTLKDGSTVFLSDVATIEDGFTDSDTIARFDGHRAAILNIYRVGEQGPVEVAQAVKSYVETLRPRLPEGLQIATWFDRSEVFEERVALLLKNSWMGLLLVIGILSVFLELRLAFWVSMGIPISFLGGLFFLPATDASINMISLFAFIMALGIVVDDAIVVGENVYAHRRMGKPPLKAAVEGTLEVMGAVTFSVLTTMAAFTPLLHIDGIMGKFIRVVPIVVILVLAVSLIEAFFILPAHLAGLRDGSKTEDNRFRRMVNRSLQRVIEGPYRKSLALAVKWRYVTLAVCVGLCMLTAGCFTAGIVGFRFMPDIENDATFCTLVMPFGTPKDETEVYEEQILKAARDTIAAFDAKREEGTILRNVFSILGGNLFLPEVSREANEAQVVVYLQPLATRKISSLDFIRSWRERVGEIPGAESLVFSAESTDFGANIAVRLMHPDLDVLEAAGDRLKAILAGYQGVTDIQDSHEEGKPEWIFSLTPEARSLGLTEFALARQVRNALYGAEALRFQRGRNEVRVMVRYPESDRSDFTLLQNMRIRTGDGGEIPFLRAADVKKARGLSRIQRIDRKRILDVTAEADADAKPGRIMGELQSAVIPELVAAYPGLTYSFEGEAGEQKESIDSIVRGFAFALLAIYVLMAIPFSSYLQPVIVMAAIPMGFIGAVSGHLLMGLDVSMMSLFGMVALTGVVVNDSLVMIDFINRNIRSGRPVTEAVLLAGERRFRPILLTSLTTFFGLAPMMMETSLQARFLIPMAVSLAFGILFATAITLVMIPALYLTVQDVKQYFVWLVTGRPAPPVAPCAEKDGNRIS